MIINSQPKQLRLNDDGQILWQADPTTPLPGAPVARVSKGDGQLKPRVDLLECDILKDEDKDAVQGFIQNWLEQHIATTLVLLNDLPKEEGIAGPAKEIAQKLAGSFGVLPRQELETLIAALDADARRVLRQRHVRLGPILAFIPEMNKPAAVRLRALLWWLWHDHSLPAPLPKDGVVSFLVDDPLADPLYYRAIGYPLYAGRAIRIDMLDRVVSAVYDGAKSGLFKATHAMAEWLGCSIADLYKVLEAMGHSKTYDPADQPAVIAEVITATVPDDTSAEQAVPDAAVVIAAVPVVAVKPELATFRLKRGRANDAEPKIERPKFEKKSFEKKSAEEPRDKNKKFKPRDKKGKPEREEKRTMTFEAKPKNTEDSPFAVLQQLKSGMKDQ